MQTIATADPTLDRYLTTVQEHLIGVGTFGLPEDVASAADSISEASTLGELPEPTRLAILSVFLKPIQS